MGDMDILPLSTTAATKVRSTCEPIVTVISADRALITGIFRTLVFMQPGSRIRATSAIIGIIFIIMIIGHTVIPAFIWVLPSAADKTAVRPFPGKVFLGSGRTGPSTWTAPSRRTASHADPRAAFLESPTANPKTCFH